MYRPNASTVALLIAVMMARFGKTRARISNVTLKKISRRSQFRNKFLSDLRLELEEWDYILVGLDRGGFGILAISTLEGATPVTANKFIAKEIGDMKKGKLNEEALSEELTTDFVDTDDE
ncbi:MAG: hypothetical protein E5X76_17855 [Mesorhizobium sp.]|nr:MAG: hypothetical protein E5X76_17855 [Mesorhizobium sp.]